MTEMAPRYKMVKIKGLKFHYIDWGDSDRVLVCLHGTSGNAHHWDRLARFLAPAYRIIALDQRGHGDTDKPDSDYDVREFSKDLEAFVDILGLTKFSLLGASLGSRVATIFAGMYPDRVSRLILVDLSFEMSEKAQQRMINGHLTRPRIFKSFEAALDYSRSNPQRSRWSEEIHQETTSYAVFQRPDGCWEWRYSLNAVLKSLQQARQDLWRYVSRIKSPTLLIRGQESDVLSDETAERALKSFHDCRFMEIEHAGHGVPRDNPQRFNEVVAEFLGSGDFCSDY